MRVGALILDFPKHNQRARKTKTHFDSFSYTGFRRIIKDCEKKYPVEYCWITEINNFDYVLVSLTSNKDVENLIYSFEKYGVKKKKVKIVAGGAGVVNIRLYKKYIDIVCFGRGENQIINILEGKEFPNVWRKEDDPDLAKTYVMRQADEIIEDEAPTVGCIRRCAFCQYAHVRKPFNYDKSMIHYTSGQDRLVPAAIEDDWRHLDVRDGRDYITAWDGLSYETRKVVNKHITDEMIVEKIEEIYRREIKVDMKVKTYCILGYPWETYDSILYDLNNLSKLIASVDRPKKVMMLRLFILVTPFMPEPLTPMQYMKSSVDTNYQMLTKQYPHCKVYKGRNIELIIIPFIPSNFTTLKRMYVNRGWEDDLPKFKRIILTPKLNNMKVDMAMMALKKNNLIPEHIVSSIKPEDSPFTYIKSYLDIDKLARYVENKIKALCEKEERYIYHA